MTKQRAHALLFQSTPGGQMARRVVAAEEMRPECSIWDSLYNQVHVSYNLSRIRAIFYVNDTVTARRLPKYNSSAEDLARGSSEAARLAAWQRQKQRLHESALRAADAALAAARVAQRLVAAEHKVILPVVQYFFTADCFRSERLATRLRMAKASGGAGVGPRLRGDATWTARVVFRLPPARP